MVHILNEAKLLFDEYQGHIKTHFALDDQRQEWIKRRADQDPELLTRPHPSKCAAPANKPNSNVPAPWTSFELGQTTSSAAAAAEDPDEPDDTSRGKPLAQSSGAQGSCSAAANPDTVEIDGVHVSTTGVTRIQTEETVGEHVDLTEEERLDLHDRKEFIDILERFTNGFVDLDNVAKSGWFDKIKSNFKSIDAYAERIVGQCGDVLRGTKFMDGNYMMTKHLVVLLMRELLHIEHFFASQDPGTVNERTKYWRVSSLRDFSFCFQHTCEHHRHVRRARANDLP